MSTLKDVAVLAGVSPATVSLALNGKAVNEETRRLVIDCAKQLNYVPNKIGQTLITGKSNSLLMLILNSTRYTNIVVDTTFFYYFIEGILEEASRHGYSVSFDVRNWEDPDLNDYFYEKVHGKSIDGLIIIPQYIRPYGFLKVLEDFPYTILNACETADSSGREISSFRIDNYLGGTLVAEYLLGLGFSSIGFINGPIEHYDAAERRRGFMDVIHSRGGSVSRVVEASGDWTIQSGYEAAEKIFRQNPVQAVFCGNDFMASGVLRYLYQNHYRVPDDVSIIGYDNIGLSSALYPRLTTVDGMLYEIGKNLGNLLLSRIGAVSRENLPVLKPRMVIRESTRPIL